MYKTNLSHSKNDEFEYIASKALFKRRCSMTQYKLVDWRQPKIYKNLFREFLMAQTLQLM